MKKLWKSGFISWCRVCIIVGHLDGPLLNNRDLGFVTLLALRSLNDARAQVLLFCTVGLPTGGNCLYHPVALRCTEGLSTLSLALAMVARPTAKNSFALEMTRGSSDL